MKYATISKLKLFRELNTCSLSLWIPPQQEEASNVACRALSNFHGAGELSPGEDRTRTLKAHASCFREFHVLRVYEPIDQMHFFSKLGDIFIMTSG